MNLQILFPILLVILLPPAAWFISRLLSVPKCKDSDVQMRLKEIDDPIGITVLKKIRVISLGFPHEIEKTSCLRFSIE